MSALKGVKVIDISRLLPGPYCSMVLADHGADVIAIEDRRFLADDLFFNDVNRNKQHMTLNLKSSEGKEIFFKLAQEADVIIEGFRPGVVHRLGVDYESVKKINPAIIYCSISGYGQNGSLQNRVGHDVNYLSQSGVLDLIGSSDSPPGIPGVQFADIAGGSLTGVIGILMALYERNSSGKGQHIDISMTDSMVGFLTLPYFLAKKQGRFPKRSEEMLSHRYACYNTYETKDGKFIALGAVEHRFWENLCHILHLPEFVDLQYSEKERERIKEKFAEVFRSENAVVWDKKLTSVDSCFSIVRSMDEVLEDPLFLEREMVVQFPGENEDEKHLGIPVKLSRTPGSLRSKPQNFGQGTREVLCTLGYTDDAIDKLFEKGVI